MCGLAGIFHWNDRPVDRDLLKRMTDRLLHRGPDDEGFHISQSSQGVNAGLGFRRLAIIDLSGGRQPMTTERQKSWIVFNGEIYNFLELRADLEKSGVQFLTRSDTEVILRLYERYGKDCVRHLRGMYAFAIWDSEKRSVFIARDRIGKKPLFYAVKDGALYFVSEMKALLEVPGLAGDVNLDAIPLYLTYQFIPGPGTIFRNVHRLPPGHTLLCDAQGKVHVEQYWRISRQPQIKQSPGEICEELRALIDEATRLRLIADVPLGAFLSGGVDSSAVVGYMARNMKEPVKTFSIGFEESDFSELEHARTIAKLFRTDHHEFVVKPDAADVLPKLAWHYDQPFADPSALPSYYVARETRKHVTVALNGDGGDENFGGYLRYQADRIFQWVACAPKPLRGAAAALLSQIPQSLQKSHLMRRMMRAGSLLGTTPDEFNFQMFAYFNQPALDRLLDGPLARNPQSKDVYEYFDSLYTQSDSDEYMDRILACDSLGYLPDCLLVKMDIASMANSLETRSPLLDHKLIEFTAKIPSKYKVKLNGGKWIFKEALKDMLPESILNRRKMGFGIPLGQWFRGPLKEFLRETVLDTKARQRGYFKITEVERIVDEHQSGKKDHGYKLWALLMFELWNKVYIDRSYRF